EQPVRARAGESVDRLIVVADDTHVVAVAQPEVEQRLLQEIDVLVLVNGERAPAPTNECKRLLVVLEQPDRAPEQVLEIERTRLVLPPLVLAEDAQREVGRQR